MIKRKRKIRLLTQAMCLTFFTQNTIAQNMATYAERLGWKKNDRVVMFHVDDAGMSFESNEGARLALAKQVATSVSVMMPCPWTSDFVNYLNANPGVDAGLHLTHTSEWKNYRWASVSGISATPVLADQQGFLWDNVPDVLSHATADEIDIEIMAQIRKARKMGFNPTHLDTHMGTLWSSPDFLEKYVQTGIREHIPVLLPAGHLTWVEQCLAEGPLSGLKKLASPDAPAAEVLDAIRNQGEKLWQAGLPVVDDIHILSYDWVFPSELKPTDVNLRNFKTEKFKTLLSSLKPGITVILIHCTEAGAHFKTISDSGHTRRADLLAMTDEKLKNFIKETGLITTTWKELQRRRNQTKP